MLRVTFLGTSGSIPTPDRNPSAIIVNRKGELLLFDCGEGTQQQMMRAKTGMNKLTSIFITHLHADHVLGIPGLIQTMLFQARKKPLTIYGPYPIENFFRLLIAMGYYKPKFEIIVKELSPQDIIKREEYVIHAFKTEHKVPSLGYALIENQRRGRFNREKAIELGVKPGPLFAKLHSGESVFVNGKEIKSEQVVGKPRPGRKMVYTGDTRPCSAVLNASKNADLLIHDSTFTSDILDWAKETMHSTAAEAAELAKAAKVRQLVLTHISSRYPDTSQLLKEAKSIFNHVCIAKEMMEIVIPYQEE
ncbi:MAG TPA: ribonuclease Z [Methanosarcinales archaeon]|nr:ribonuclease Z [Methanosarcinales archaeon]